MPASLTTTLELETPSTEPTPASVDTWAGRVAALDLATAASERAERAHDAAEEACRALERAMLVIPPPAELTVDVCAGMELIVDGERRDLQPHTFTHRDSILGHFKNDVVAAAPLLEAFDAWESAQNAEAQRSGYTAACEALDAARDAMDAAWEAVAVCRKSVLSYPTTQPTILRHKLRLLREDADGITDDVAATIRAMIDALEPIATLPADEEIASLERMGVVLDGVGFQWPTGWTVEGADRLMNLGGHEIARLQEHVRSKTCLAAQADEEITSLLDASSDEHNASDFNGPANTRISELERLLSKVRANTMRGAAMQIAYAAGVVDLIRTSPTKFSPDDEERLAEVDRLLASALNHVLGRERASPAVQFYDSNYITTVACELHDAAEGAFDAGAFIDRYAEIGGRFAIHTFSGKEWFGETFARGLSAEVQAERMALSHAPWKMEAVVHEVRRRHVDAKAAG